MLKYLQIDKRGVVATRVVVAPAEAELFTAPDDTLFTVGVTRTDPPRAVADDVDVPDE